MNLDLKGFKGFTGLKTKAHCFNPENYKIL
jgi:hypothetical protein